MVDRDAVPNMKARLTLHAGQRGTKQLMAQYGERLVCVRYRYDLQRTVKAAGGKWNAEKKVWELQYRHVVKLGLQDRVCERV